MRLKKIKINGFKSFADKVILDFDAKIIGIVGPNGCGKSNIVDAFRWVMGEQSAKSLRGDKMHDVIFAGTDKRKPLNIAEVSVTFTEINGQLPVEYDEITITRRLYRDGESEYLFNQKQVRLKDISHLLMGTGVGKNAFSIFEQGKLDQIIYQTPLERRFIFDESAGISRFIQNKKDTVKKLEQVSLNYTRIKDIHAEVDKQTRVLRKQAFQAKHYQELKSTLENLQKDVLLFNLQQVYQNEKGFLEQLELGQKEQRTFKAVLQEIVGSLEEKKGFLQVKEKELIETREKTYHAQSLCKIKQNEEKRLKETLTDLEALHKRLQKDIHAIQTSRQESLEALKNNEGKLLELEALKSALEVEVQEKKKGFENADVEIHQLREKLKSIQKEYLEAVKEENHLKSQLQEKKVRYENNQNQLKKTVELLEGKEHLIELTEKDLINKKSSVKELSDSIDAVKNEIKELERALGQIKLELQEKYTQLSSLTVSITDARAREKSLKRLQDDLEGFSKGAKLLKKENNNPKSPLFGKIKWLFEYVEPTNGNEQLTAIALKPYEETCVVRTKEDRQLVLDVAKHLKIEDFSILCLESLKEKEESFVESHFLKSFSIKENVDELLECSSKETKKELLSKDLYYLNHHKVLFQRRLGEDKNPILRDAEIKSLGKMLVELEEKKRKLEEHQSALFQKRHHIEDKKRHLEEVYRKKEMTLVQENFSLQRLMADLEKEKKERRRLLEESKKQQTLDSDSQVILEQLEKATQKMTTKKELLQEAITVLEKELDCKLIVLKELSLDKQQKEKDFASCVLQWNKLVQEVKIFEAKDEERSLQEKKKTEEIKSTYDKMLVLEINQHVLEAEVKTSQCAYEEKMSSLNLLQGELKKFKDGLQTFEKHFQDKKQQEVSMQHHLHQMEVKLASIQSQRQNVEKELLDTFQIHLEEALTKKVTLNPDLPSTEKKILELKLELEKTGPINMHSIAEYREHEERFAELNQQLLDLEESKKDLEAIIGKLEGESRKLFKKTFESIRHSFQKNFKILFDGGEADLKFTEHQDVLEAGIEIIAKPPGKQMKSISLLSGGEKCMTALALLFALFEIKPAPFCILDEVDAPLDESNIVRFTKVLQQFVDKTQFVIVTHNKKTMAVADLLFGVSMEEKGISKLLSLNFAPKTVSSTT